MAEDPAIQNLVSALAGCDWAVCEGFLNVPQVTELRAEAEALRAAGRFQAAGVGQDALRRADIRSDESLWLTSDATPRAWSFVQRELEALRLAVNAATYLGLHEFEGHYAAYPPGAAYARHLDRFRGDNQRVVSVVLYLNDAWGAGDGGELRLYPEGLTCQRTGDPVAQRRHPGVFPERAGAPRGIGSATHALQYRGVVPPACLKALPGQV